MRLVLTANGPGEVAGWVRPLLTSLYSKDPKAEVHLFIVPDDYATGMESRVASRLFPQASVYDPKRYLSVALGGRGADLPNDADVVQYLGGDLMHAARLHRRFGGSASTYKFSRRSYREMFLRAFAVDEPNAESLIATGIARERVAIVGNLAIDGAYLESQLQPEAGAPTGGILIMPGSRRYEVEHLVPFFFTMALHVARERPDIPIAFGISPFTDNDQVRSAIEKGGDWRVFARKGKLLHDGDAAYLAAGDGSQRFPVLRRPLAAARLARLAVTLPGTKCIELAALGVPMIAITPLNAPELAALNGPLTYLDRIPVAGAALKRSVAVALSRRHLFHTQPNIDLGAMVVRELHGTLTPGRVARVTLDSFEDRPWLAESASRLAGLYARHAGAADRMATGLLDLCALRS